MIDKHPDRGALERFLAGELSSEEDAALQRHMFTCATCEGSLLGILPGSGEEDIPGPLGGSVSQTLIQRIVDEKLPALVRRRLDLAAERAEAAGLWQELRGHDSESRRLLVTSYRSYQTWGLFELLIDQSRETLPQKPQEAEDLVRLALAVAEHLDADVYGDRAVETAKVRAWAHLGNTVRVLSDFQQAEQAFQQAEAHFTWSWLDPVDEALILEFRGTMRRTQGRYAEAIALLDGAIALYREVNESHHHGRVLMVKGLALLYQGDPEAAAECFRTSLYLIDEVREPRLLMMSQCNLLRCMHESGRSDEAALLIPEAKALVEQVGKRSDLLRFTWIAGKIQATIGQWTVAERAFHWIRESFIEDGFVFDAALVSLDLAALYVSQGKPAEARHLATEMLPIFRSREIHREALAALIVFQQAAEMEQLTLGLVEAVSGFLEQARNNPDLRFREEAPTD